MKAVILAGGKGTRLGALAQDIPKPMVSVGGMSVLQHQLKLLKRYGIKEVILITGHLSEVIERDIGDGTKFGLTVAYYREQQPLGTTGGLKEMEHRLTDDFFVLYGDVMIDLDLRSLEEYHRRKRGVGTLVVHPNDHPHDSDLLELDQENRVIAVHPKPHEETR